MSPNERSVTLRPSWKAYIWNYLWGILLSPLLIGIYLLWKTRKEQASTYYTITDRRISVTEGHITQNIDLADIRQANAGELRFGTGSVILKTRGRTIELKGLEHPETISRSIEKAVEAELKRLEAEKQTKPGKVNYEPGTMDRLDYLTGLWQQGLLSDEDFQAEQEKFKGQN